MNSTEKLMKDRFSGRTVTLLGAGVSNRPLASVLSSLGAKVSVRDKKTADQLGDNADALTACGASLILGDGYLDGMNEDYIFRSPSFRPDMPAIAQAVSRGSVLTSEMDSFLEISPCPVYAVTGSAGKTTTTTLVSLMLEAGMIEAGGGRVFLGGNIGDPLLYRAAEMNGNDAVAVELSSFQLMTARAHFAAAVITNITPNHLNWHTGMDEYIAAKAKIVSDCGRAVIGYGCEITRKIGKKVSAPVTYFSRSPIPLDDIQAKDTAVFPEGEWIVEYHGKMRTELLRMDDILLPGLHNAENYMAAIAATRGKVSLDAVRKIARTFGGVPHRLELVGKKGGVEYYNSSIDSSPDRTAAALSALPGRSIVLIAGGCDKNLVYEPLADAIIGHGGIRTVVLNGQTAAKIGGVLTGHKDFAGSGIGLIYRDTLDEAVRYAAKAAKDGDVVLLSPASTSFDQFENFEKRGERFRQLVGEI